MPPRSSRSSASLGSSRSSASLGSGDREELANHARSVTFAQKNPKKRSSQAGIRYDKYKRAKTIEEALQGGATINDLKSDLHKGYMKFAEGIPPVAQPSSSHTSSACDSVAARRAEPCSLPAPALQVSAEAAERALEQLCMSSLGNAEVPQPVLKLLKTFESIEENPSIASFRSFHLDDEDLQLELICHDGAMEFLRAAGFVHSASEVLELPSSSDASFRAALCALRRCYANVSEHLAALAVAAEFDELSTVQVHSEAFANDERAMGSVAGAGGSNSVSAGSDSAAHVVAPLHVERSGSGTCADTGNVTHAAASSREESSFNAAHAEAACAEDLFGACRADYFGETAAAFAVPSIVASPVASQTEVDVPSSSTPAMKPASLPTPPAAHAPTLTWSASKSFQHWRPSAQQTLQHEACSLSASSSCIPVSVAAGPKVVRVEGPPLAPAVCDDTHTQGVPAVCPETHTQVSDASELADDLHLHAPSTYRGSWRDRAKPDCELDVGEDVIRLRCILGFVRVKKEPVDDEDNESGCSDRPASSSSSSATSAGPAPGPHQDIGQMLLQPRRQQSTGLEEPLDSPHNPDTESQSGHNNDFEAAQMASYEANVAEKQDRERRDRDLVAQGDLAPCIALDESFMESLMNNEAVFEFLQSGEHRSLLFHFLNLKARCRGWYREAAQIFFAEQQDHLISMLEQQDVPCDISEFLTHLTNRVEEAIYGMLPPGRCVPEIFAPKACASDGCVDVEDSQG